MGWYSNLILPKAILEVQGYECRLLFEYQRTEDSRIDPAAICRSVRNCLGTNKIFTKLTAVVIAIRDHQTHDFSREQGDRFIVFGVIDVLIAVDIDRQLPNYFVALLLPPAFNMVRIIACLFVSTNVYCLIVERHVIGESVVIELVISTRKILVDKNLQTIVVPILNERIAMPVLEHVISNDGEDVEFVVGPGNFIAYFKVFAGIFGTKTAMV